MTKPSKELLESLKKHEGFRAEAYVDTTGHLTIGYGQVVGELKVTEKEAEKWLLDGIAAKTKELETFLAFRNIDSQVRKDVLIEMAYNLGVGGLMKFRNMWASIKAGDYEAASVHMLDSRWASQVKSRAHTLANRMKTGEY
jgi:lysozyme